MLVDTTSYVDFRHEQFPSEHKRCPPVDHVFSFLVCRFQHQQQLDYAYVSALDNELLMRRHARKLQNSFIQLIINMQRPCVLVISPRTALTPPFAGPDCVCICPEPECRIVKNFEARFAPCPNRQTLIMADHKRRGYILKTRTICTLHRGQTLIMVDHSRI